MNEYTLVMQPVAQCLNMLQGEKRAYMGTLLPQLWLMKTSLEEKSENIHLVYARPLVQALLSGYEKRFGHLFQNRDLLMATALHPSFTLKALESIAPDMVEEIGDRITREIGDSIKPTEKQQQRQLGQPTEKEPHNSDALLFSKLFSRVLVRRASQQQDVEIVIRKSMEEWVPSQEDPSCSCFPNQHREIWIDLFIKYNTPIPSSAAVERCFSAGGDILRAKRSSLKEERFEDLLFLKGNMDLLQEVISQEDMEEEEDL